MSRIAIIGAGFVGQSWAILFARAGHQVSIYDANPKRADHVMRDISLKLVELASYDLVEDVDQVKGNIDVAESLSAAVDGVVHVQEATNENLEIKREVFAELDGIVESNAVLASSSSTIPASEYSEDLKNRSRCILAHPLNPPHLVPVVEIGPAPWTSEKAVKQTTELMSSIGQVPVILKKEIPGFIVNRLQVALLNEAFALVEDGCVSAEDLDKAIVYGLGLRWSTVGPFETIDLNASEGVKHYANIFGEKYYRMMKDRGPVKPWSSEIVSAIDAQLRQIYPLDDIPSRQTSRDTKLMKLAVLRETSD